MHPLRPVRPALPRGHHHHGSVPPVAVGTDRSDPVAGRGPGLHRRCRLKRKQAMPDEKKSAPEPEPEPETETELTRRQFFVKVGLGSIAVAGLVTTVFGYQFLSPY